MKNIEAHVEDRYFIIGETLFEQGKVIGLVEAERHLWLANVVNREVEVQITPSKVRACTCECENYKISGICEHIAAVLLKLRNEVDKIKDKEEKKRKKRNYVAKKLTTSIILEKVSHEEIKYFIRDFAKSNKNFALALKARFAAAVPMQDDRLKYYQLLDNIINEARTTNDRVLYKGKLKILKIIKELLAQTDDYIVGENFTDAFYILQAIIEKGSPIYNKIEGNADNYFTEIENAFKLLKSLMESNLAPSMLEDIWLFCLRECVKTTYRLSGFSSLIFNLLLDLANDNEKIEELLEVLNSEIDKLVVGGKRKASLLITKLTLLEKRGQTKDAEEVVLANLEEPRLLIYIVNQSLEKKKYKRAKMLLLVGLEQNFSQQIRCRLEELMLKVVQVLGSNKEILEFAHKKFLFKKEIVDYELMKSIKGEKLWNSYLEKLIVELNDQPFSLEKRDVLAEIYFRENRADDLLTYIESIRSLDLLQHYAVDLLKNKKAEVAALYESILDSFIKHHLGRKSSEKIKRAILHLYTIKADRLANKIVRNFRKKYPERFTLIDELADF